MKTVNPLVLIVEDQPALAQLYQKAFTEADYDTEVFYEGDKAANWLADGKPDIVVLDLNLPYVSGKKLLQQIKADFRLQHTQVLLVSAYVQAADFVVSQADFVLTKPISYLQLHKLAARLRPTV
ncbi:MAG: response regulator [Chloroflexota bacterium]